MSDTTDAQWDQLEQEGRRFREDELLRRCRKLTAEKKLTDDEFRVEFDRFTSSMRSITNGDEHG